MYIPYFPKPIGVGLGYFFSIILFLVSFYVFFTISYRIVDYGIREKPKSFFEMLIEGLKGEVKENEGVFGTIVVFLFFSLFGGYCLLLVSLHLSNYWESHLLSDSNPGFMKSLGKSTLVFIVFYLTLIYLLYINRRPKKQ